MAKLTQEMMDLVKGKMAYVATVAPDGTPLVGPKASFKVFDDEHGLLSHPALVDKRLYVRGSREFVCVNLTP